MPKLADIKRAIRPIYAQLQGYLAEAPKADGPSWDSRVYSDYDQLLDELSRLARKDYSKHKLSGMVECSTYRMVLAGLIARLHTEYFSDEPLPFATMPSTVITQTQAQSVQVEIAIEITSWLSDALHKTKEGSPERKFLEKLRGTVSKVKNVGQFVSLLITTAKEFSLSIDQLKDLLS